MASNNLKPSYASLTTSLINNNSFTGANRQVNALFEYGSINFESDPGRLEHDLLLGLLKVAHPRGWGPIANNPDILRVNK